MSNGPKLIITSEQEKAGYDAVAKSEGKKEGNAYPTKCIIIRIIRELKQ